MRNENSETATNWRAKSAGTTSIKARRKDMLQDRALPGLFSQFVVVVRLLRLLCWLL
jgi:hypothetical protein